MMQNVSTAASDADERRFSELRSTFEQAANTNNLDLLAPCLDPEFTAVTYTNREFLDFSAFKTQWQKTREAMLKGGSYSVKLLPEQRWIMGDTSVSRGNSENVLTAANGSSHQFNAHWTVVCRRTGGQWKILRAHCSLDPFGNPMLKSAVKAFIVKCGIIAGLVGAIAGVVIGVLL
jgi:ketosteroid isomerase-like protein